MATTTAIDQKRQEWLEQRRQGIGGSDAASLLPDDSRYGCNVRLWYDKRGQQPDYERTPAEKKILDRGNRLEDVAAEQFSLEYDFKVRRHQTRIHPEFTYLRVNIDRQIVNVTKEEMFLYWPEIQKEYETLFGDAKCGPGVLEVKTSNEWVVRNALKQGIITDYIFQLQHGMAVTGYKWGVMAILDTSTFELTVFVVLRKESIIKILLEEAGKFWALVENGPKPDVPDFPQGDTRCRSCIFRKTCRGEQYLMQLAGEKPDTGYVADDSFSELASDLKEILRQKETIESTEDEIKRQIKERMEAAAISKLEVPSVGVKVRWTENKPPHKWDTKGLEAEAAQIGRHLHFVEWMERHDPELLAELTAEFQQQHRNSPSLAAKYKAYGAPSRPFVFVSL